MLNGIRYTTCHWAVLEAELAVQLLVFFLNVEMLCQSVNVMVCSATGMVTLQEKHLSREVRNSRPCLCHR